MTAADLARIAAAIERDADVEAANWPLSRDRERAYIELARECVKASKLPPGVWFALAALGDDADAGAVAGEAGTQLNDRDRGIKTCKPATFSPRNPPPVLAMFLCAWCDGRLDMVAKQGCLALADRGACNRDGWGQLKDKAGT